MKVDWFVCRNAACEDNGGTCLLAIPGGYTEPTGCTTPEEATGSKWEHITQEKAMEWIREGPE